MARKRRAENRARPDAPANASPVAAAATAVPASRPAITEADGPGTGALSREVVREDWTALVFALMMVLAPALGVPDEFMLQDTLKSIVVAMATLGAALLFFLVQRSRTEPLRWHGIVAMPLALMAYALGSMAWSHTYLAGVEAIRWFLFAVILWLGLQTLTRQRIGWVAIGIHVGALFASTWAALQFWTGWNFFPQGPNPASTFINRNFFAEFVVATLPFSMWLLARARRSPLVALLAVSNGWVIVTILMTGTRGALIALWLQLLVVWPLIAWKCRDQLAFATWPRLQRVAAPLLLLATVVIAGIVPSGNPKILEEGRGTNALGRAFIRTQSIQPGDESLNLRLVMWRATLDMVRDRPLTGVGAGAWESEVPRYQAAGSQLETDYYVHNEVLQLVAEYGAVGWFVLIALAAYLLLAAWRTWNLQGEEERREAPVRAMLLCALLAFLIVSNVGFPWRMAATGALFALCLGGLAASDARLATRTTRWLRPVRWSPLASRIGIGGSLAALGLALYITHLAAQSERLLVGAAKIALTISASGDWNNPRWNDAKAQMLQLTRDGVAINRHYRKVTPMIADELARWNDWKDAVWVWESVLSSRPYVVAMLSNAARGYSSMGQQAQAMALMERAKRIQPDAPSVRSLEVVLLARAGEEARALALAKDAVAKRQYDFDLVNAMLVLAWRAGDPVVAEQAAALKMREWPDSRFDTLLQLGQMYAGKVADPAKAVDAYRQAFAIVNENDRDRLLAAIPANLRAQVAASAPTAPASAPQRSSSKR